MCVIVKVIEFCLWVQIESLCFQFRYPYYSPLVFFYALPSGYLCHKSPPVTSLSSYCQVYEFM